MIVSIRHYNRITVLPDAPSLSDSNTQDAITTCHESRQVYRFNSGLPAVFEPPMWHKYLIARKSATMPHPPAIEAPNIRSRAPRMLGRQYRSFVSVYLVNVSHARIISLSCIIHYSSCCSCLRGECSNRAVTQSACEPNAAYVGSLVCAVIHLLQTALYTSNVRQ